MRIFNSGNKTRNIIIISRIASTILRNPLPEYREGLCIIMLFILDSISNGTSIFHKFSHGASLHHYSLEYLSNVFIHPTSYVHVHASGMPLVM